MSKGLRHLAEQDLGKILEDDMYGFGWPIVVTDPEGRTANLIGRSNDVSQIIDTETGLVISGRSATVAIRIKLLTENNLGVPVGVAELEGKPWLVKFDDVNGTSYVFKVSKTNPDRSIGMVTCVLENYRL